MPIVVGALLSLAALYLVGAAFVAALFALAAYLGQPPKGAATRASVRGRVVNYQRDGRAATVHGIEVPISIETRHGAGGPPPIETGDPVFDTEVRLLGSPEAVRALFDAALRDRFLRTFRGCRLELVGGVADIDSSKRPGELITVVSDAIVLVEDLERAAREPQERRLFARATSDPVAGVRMRAMTTLLAVHPDSSEAAEARRLAAEDPDPSVRRVALGDRDGAIALADDSARGQLSPTPNAGAVSLPKPRRPA